MAWFGGCAAIAGILTWARLNLSWFPLLPIGFAVVSPFTIGVAVRFACLVAWAAKQGVMRWGGLPAYRRAAPFFVGLCAGHFAGRALAISVGSAYGARLL